LRCHTGFYSDRFLYGNQYYSIVPTYADIIKMPNIAGI
jgi:hypothetical protein